MQALSVTLFSLATLTALWSARAFGPAGVWGGATLQATALIALAVAGWSDASVIAVQVLTLGLSFFLTWRAASRESAWKARMSRQRNEGLAEKGLVERHIQLLKEKIVTSAAEVDRGSKQYELVKRLSEATAWEEMVPSLDKALKHFFQADAWALYLTDEQGELGLVQRRGAVPEAGSDATARREPYQVTFVPATGISAGKSAWAIGIPLWRLHEFIGLLLIRPGDRYGDDQSQAALLSEAAAFGTQLIFAMAKAKLFRELQQRSRTDGLTGLTRRGPFEERLAEEIARAASFRTTFSILMIDIDHFKRMNDSYGHQVGDEVLRTVAQRLKEGFYETDVIARYGGEEFVCLLPRSIPAGLRTKAEHIRQRVEQQAFVIGLESVTVTISIGIAHYPQDGDSAQAVMAAADRALYAAKANGRNQVVEAAALRIEGR